MRLFVVPYYSNQGLFVTQSVLLQNLAVVLTQLSIGTLIMTGLLSTRDLRTGLFAVNSLVCAIAAAVALVLTRVTLTTGWWDVRYLGLTVIGATAAYGCFRLDRPEIGRLLLIASAILGVFFGLLPLSTKVLRMREISTTAPWFFDAGMITGALLLGAAVATVSLARWYQLMRGLPLEHLQLFSRALLGSIGLRIVAVIFTMVAMDQFDAKAAALIVEPLWPRSGHSLLFVLRVVFGLALPFVVAFVVMRAVQTETDRSITAKLYLVMASVLVGEMLAAYLLI